MKIVLCSPVSFSSGNESGIHIRVKEIEKYLCENGHTVKLIDKYNESVIKRFEFVYCLVSTKKDSITYKVVQGLKPQDTKLITDLYTPILLEKDLTYSPFNPINILTRTNQVSIVKQTLAASTYFIVANKRQKSYWRTQAEAWGIKLNKNNIAVIPTSHNFRLKKSRNGKVILWFGGVYPWLDPTPLARAFLKIAARFPGWKLKILGGFYEGTGYDKIYKNSTKVFNKIPKNQLEIAPWQNLKDLPNYLNDVAFAVHLPKDAKEDLYAHRVRLLTLTNSHIPVLTSGKDEISKIIVEQKAGTGISTEPNILAGQLTKIINNSKNIMHMVKNTDKVETTLLKNNFDDKIFSKQSRG